MTCEACTVILRERLGKVPGIARVEVSFEEKTARIFLSSDQEITSEEQLLAAIQQAGYSGMPLASTRTVPLAVK